MRAIRFLTVQEILEAHAATIKRHGGAAGIRDTGILDSAVHMPQAMYGGEIDVASDVGKGSVFRVLLPIA